MEQTALKLELAENGNVPHRGMDLEGVVELSVVIPIADRHDDLRLLSGQYLTELRKTGLTFEVTFVLDGFEPDALSTLRAIKSECPGINVIILSRPFGEATALSAGFENAKGQTILTLPSYLQVEPSEIPRLLQALKDEESDLVVAWRHPRVDSRFNRLQSRVFHLVVGLLVGTKYHDISCGVRAMKRKVAEEIPLYADLHRFLPIAAYQHGFRISEVAVRQSSQDAKRRVYAPGVYVRRLIDIFTCFFLFKFTKKPLRFFGMIGSGIFAMGMTVTGYIGLERLFNMAPAGRPLLILGVLLMVLGVQLFSTGLLGEIIIFTHARDLKEYQIAKILD